jgi:deoxyribonuclease V
MGPDPGPGGPFGLAGTWPRSPAEAVLWQEALAARIQPEGDPGPVCYVAGCDVAYRGEWAYGVVLLFEYATGRLLSHSWARERARFPYVPGLLSFREVPVLLEAFFRLEGPEPDLVLCDGQGIAHPRRMGLGRTRSAPGAGPERLSASGQGRGDRLRTPDPGAGQAHLHFPRPSHRP